jgi:hypothetical protein
MQRSAAKIFGFLVLGLGIIGLIVGDTQWLGLINVDLFLDVARLGLAVLLLYAVYAARDDGFTRMALLTFGMAYVLIGALGVVSPDVFGLLPSRLSGFDITFHLLAGVAALGIAAYRSENVATHA